MNAALRECNYEGDNFMTKRIIALIAPFVMMLSMPVAAAPGGIPEMVAVLQAAVASLTTQVANLQTNNNTLATQVAALTTSSSNLQAALNGEILARKAGDTALQNSINAEAADSDSIEAGLQAQITALNNKPSASAPLWALINANDGTLVRGQGVVSVQTLSPGSPNSPYSIFIVKFNQDVSQCAYQATGVDLADGLAPVFEQPIGVGTDGGTMVSVRSPTIVGSSRVTASLAVFCK